MKNHNSAAYYALSGHAPPVDDITLRDSPDLYPAYGSVVDRLDRYAEAAVREYDPAPGREVGGLFHEFVQSKRGPVRRAIGNTSAAVLPGLAAAKPASVAR